MGRKRQKRRAVPAHSAGTSRRRRGVWVLWAVVVVVVIGTISAAAWMMSRGGPAPSPVATGPTPAPSSMPAKTDSRQRLIGRWLRPDGGYILAIASVAGDGEVTATYHNPQPIYVARARAAVAGGTVTLYVELRDQGYPDNNYTLVYDPGRDVLGGVYRQLAIGQSFDVVFVRQPNLGLGR